MKAAQSIFFIRYVGWTHVLYGFFFRDDMILFSSNDITKTKMHSMECNDERYRAIPLYFNPNNPCFKDDRITTRRRKRWGKTIYNTSLVLKRNRSISTSVLGLRCILAFPEFLSADICMFCNACYFDMV